MKNEDGEKVKKGRKNYCLLWLQNTRGNYSGNRIGCIMKAIHEIKCKG